MLPDRITLEVVTPERRVVNETVDEVVLPGETGYLGVLPGHAPLLTGLAVGGLMYRKGTEKHFLSIAWGFAEVLPERVIVLADIAERAEEIDIERAKAKKAEIEEEIRRAQAETDMDMLGASLKKAVVRIRWPTGGRGALGAAAAAARATCPGIDRSGRVGPVRTGRGQGRGGSGWRVARSCRSSSRRLTRKHGCRRRSNE